MKATDSDLNHATQRRHVYNFGNEIRHLPANKKLQLNIEKTRHLPYKLVLLVLNNEHATNN